MLTFCRAYGQIQRLQNMLLVLSLLGPQLVIGGARPLGTFGTLLRCDVLPRGYEAGGVEFHLGALDSGARGPSGLFRRSRNKK